MNDRRLRLASVLFGVATLAGVVVAIALRSPAEPPSLGSPPPHRPCVPPELEAARVVDHFDPRNCQLRPGLRLPAGEVVLLHSTAELHIWFACGSNADAEVNFDRTTIVLHRCRVPDRFDGLQVRDDGESLHYVMQLRSEEEWAWYKMRGHEFPDEGFVTASLIAEPGAERTAVDTTCTLR